MEKEREMEMERERLLAQGVKARIPVVLKQKPFLPTGSDREPVRPIDSHLRTELRSEERRQYEQRRKEKEAEMEAARQEVCNLFCDSVIRHFSQSLLEINSV